MESNPFWGADGTPSLPEKLFPNLTPEVMVDASNFFWEQAKLHPEKEQWFKLASHAVYIVAVARKKLELFRNFADAARRTS